MEREAQHLRKAFEFSEGAAARQEEINRARGTRLHERHYEKTMTVRQIERGNKQGEEQIITAEYKFSLTDQIATETAKPFMVSSAPQDEHGTDTRKGERKHSDKRFPISKVSYCKKQKM